jgi:hypothetical protein
MLNDYVIAQYCGKDYKVCKCKDGTIYVIDADIVLPPKPFYNTKVGYISCRLKEKPAYLHHLVMDFVFDGTWYVEHINRIKTDNRRENLKLLTQSDQNKNQRKRSRNVVLPESSINVEDIPTFIWYVKANKSHGDRWAIEIKDKYMWRTTSAKNVSTKCKLEIAKKQLRTLSVDRPELFQGHCMNGELQADGANLAKSYYNILQIAGISYHDNTLLRTSQLLKEDLNGLSAVECELVKSHTIKNAKSPMCEANS